MLSISLLIFIGRAALIAGSTCSDQEIAEISANIKACATDLVDRYYSELVPCGMPFVPQERFCFFLSTFEEACASLAQKCPDQVDVGAMRTDIKSRLKEKTPSEYRTFIKVYNNIKIDVDSCDKTKPSDKIAPQAASPDCGGKQTCSECRGTSGCSWCSSPGVDLSSRCNSRDETSKVCPVQGAEKTASMVPTPIPKPYWYKINDAGFPHINPQHVRMELNAGEEKTIDFTFHDGSGRRVFSNNLPDFVELKIMHGPWDVTEIGICTSRGKDVPFQAHLRLKSCPEDPTLWREHAYKINSSFHDSDALHIHLTLLCSCPCDKFSGENICRNDKKTYTELNPCSKHNTCSECLRNAECNWCSDPDFAYVDGTPLPRCNNDSFFTSKLCPEAKRVDPWRALTGSEDCSDCKHTCSGGICSEDKKEILEEKVCSTHLTCTECMQAKDCGWCPNPETGSNCNRLDNWIKSSDKKTSENQVICQDEGEIQGNWRTNVSHSKTQFFNNSGLFYDIHAYSGNPWKERQEDWEIEENVIRVTTKTMEPIKLSVEWDVTQARGPLNEYKSEHKKGHPKDAIELVLTSQRYYNPKGGNSDLYVPYTRHFGLEYTYTCDDRPCTDDDKIEDLNKMRFDVTLTVLECVNVRKYTVWLKVVNKGYRSSYTSWLRSTATGFNQAVQPMRHFPYGILRLEFSIPKCSCDCETKCNAGYLPFQPVCRGGISKCGACSECPEDAFGEFCECTKDGKNLPMNTEDNLTNLPSVEKGTKDELAGRRPPLNKDKISFGHAIHDPILDPSFGPQCNATFCKSTGHCGNLNAILGDHRLLPGAELGIKFDVCGSFYFGMGTPTTWTEGSEKAYRQDSNLYYFADDFIGYKMMGKDDAKFVHGECKHYREMKFEHKNLKPEEWNENNQEVVNPIKNHEFNIRVTESEVIWSWDNFSTVWKSSKWDTSNYVYIWTVNKTFDATEKRYEVNTREKAFYPVLVYGDCTLGESNSFEILYSKVGA